MKNDDNKTAIGLVAGSRRLPFQFTDWAKRSGYDLYIVGIKGEVDEKLKNEVGEGRYREFYVTEITKVIDFFKAYKVNEVVMIGGIARAKLKITFDLVKVVARLMFMKNKHKGVFTVILSMFDKRDLKVRAIQDFMPELLIREGSLGKANPTEDDLAAFNKNFPAILNYIRTGTGQAIIIYKGEILSFENIKGTDDMIARATAKRCKLGASSGGIMAKIMEPGQDNRLDLPVVGTGTIEILAKNGIDGVIVEAGRTIVDDMSDTIKLADEKNVFVYGLKI
ncbi:MAG: UDP-2,3-diacylglucosamine diphosphatase LpxI [Azoarcus sp.]|jgi:DUF1009 family protein|nr:UDP-2,3-diacylglucosamine diphosphatase LpxI [Azoarcus sp.]